jgi:hypothetical protein
VARSRRAGQLVADWHDRAIAVGTLVALAVGGLLHLIGRGRVGDVILAVAVGLLLVALTLDVYGRSFASAASA